jgi:cobalt-zinc-cadmium efflux system outer membrane protein
MKANPKHAAGLLFIFLFPAAARINGQTVPVLSMDTIIRRIDQNNQQLQTYQYKAEGFRFSADAATAWLPPMAGAGTFMTPYPFQKKVDPGNRGALMFRLEQDIPVFSRLKAKKTYLRSLGDIEKVNRTIILNDFKAQSRILYCSWVVALRQLKLLQENDQLLAMLKKIETVRYPHNRSDLADVYRIDAKREENQNNILALETGIDRSRVYLNTLMNRPPGELFTVDSSYSPMFIDVVADSASLAESRSDVLKMDATIRAMQYNIAALQQEKKPSFKIQFDHMSSLGGMPQAFSVMGMISIPLAPWASKMYQSEIKAISFNTRGMETERSAIIQEAQGRLEGLQYEIRSLQKKTEAMKSKIIPALQQSREIKFLQYQENKAALKEVMDAWEAVNMMQTELWDQQLKLYQMIVEYEKELYK